MVEFELIDETFDINITSQYHISIQVSLNGYCFSVLDLRRNKYILLKNYVFTEELATDQIGYLANLQLKDEFLTRDYHSVSVIVVSDKSTIVPLPLFVEQNIERYFEFNHGLSDGDVPNFNKLKQSDAVIVYSVPAVFEKSILSRFPNAKFYNQAKPFIEKNLIDNKNKGNETKVFVNVQKEFFDILVINQNKIELYNSFRYKTESDFAFFILYVFDQLKLNPEETRLSVCGEIQKDSPQADLIKTFLKEVDFEKYSTQSLYSYTLANVPAHRFYNLLNLYHCE
jgi:hypothetical protein